MGEFLRAGRWRAQTAVLRGLSWADRALLVEAMIVVTTVGLALRFVTVQRVYAALASGKQPATSSAITDEQRGRAVEVARLVSMASRHTILPNTCLHRSLALWWLLRRRGFDSQLRFGSRKKDDAFEAHAWVEYADAVVGDDPNTPREYLAMPWLVVNSKV